MDYYRQTRWGGLAWGGGKWQRECVPGYTCTFCCLVGTGKPEEAEKQTWATQPNTYVHMHIWSTVTLPVYFRAHSRQSFNRKQKRKERNKQTNTKNRRPFNFVIIYFVFHFWNGRVISTRCTRRALILNPFWCELYSLPVNAIKPTVSFVNSKKKNTQSRRWEASRKKKKRVCHVSGGGQMRRERKFREK